MGATFLGTSQGLYSALINRDAMGLGEMEYCCPYDL